jgi:hypothetical protein
MIGAHTWRERRLLQNPDQINVAKPALWQQTLDGLREGLRAKRQGYSERFRIVACGNYIGQKCCDGTAISKGNLSGDSLWLSEGGAIRRSTNDVESVAQPNRIISAYGSRVGRQVSLGEAVVTVIALETAAQSAQRELFRHTYRIIEKAERCRVFDVTESTSPGRLNANPADSAYLRYLRGVYGARKMSSLTVFAAIETVRTYASGPNCAFNRSRPCRLRPECELRNGTNYHECGFTRARPRLHRVPVSSNTAKSNATENPESSQHSLRKSCGMPKIRRMVCIHDLDIRNSPHSSSTRS